MVVWNWLRREEVPLCIFFGWKTFCISPHVKFRENLPLSSGIHLVVFLAYSSDNGYTLWIVWALSESDQWPRGESSWQLNQSPILSTKTPYLMEKPAPNDDNHNSFQSSYYIPMYCRLLNWGWHRALSCQGVSMFRWSELYCPSEIDIDGIVIGKSTSIWLQEHVAYVLESRCR